MYELLKQLHENGMEMSFLFPGLDGRPISGKVEAISYGSGEVDMKLDGIRSYQPAVRGIGAFLLFGCTLHLWACGPAAR